MKWIAVCFIAAVLVTGWGTAAAQKPATEQCNVEDWRYTHTPALRILTIEGSTTCQKGHIRIRAYDTSDGSLKFMGVADGTIKGYIFTALVTAIYEKPASMKIKYRIVKR